jgi:hypothetical protein
MKRLFFASLMMASLFTAHADIDLKEGFNGKSKREFIRTIKSGQRIAVDFKTARYVEEIMIFAEGKQRAFSFADVYADGELISTLGVPGFDPDYPVVVRGKVKKIEVVARANSKVAILDFQVFTKRKNYNSYSSISLAERSNFSLDDWGKHVLDSVHELYFMMRDQGLMSKEEFIQHVQPIRRMAIETQASDDARDADSLKTYMKAKKLAKAIVAAAPLFDNTMMVMDQRLDMLVIDLKTIKEDISEKYDVNVE